MPYYSVIPLSPARRERYTYRTGTDLPNGSVVSIRFGRRQDLGIVWSPVEPHVKAALAEPTGVVLPDTTRELAAWVSREYLAPLGVALKLTLNKQIIQYAPEVSAASAAALASPEAATDTPRPLLLIGPRRAIRYRELVSAARQAQTSTLVIVPEINLTPEAVERYGGALAETVAYHSRLTPKQRAAVWWRVATGDPVTVVGTRSALWLPWERLGLLVLDEEDDPNYKQEQTPRYHARPVAARLAQLTGASLVYGSVTPSLEAYAQAMEGRVTIETLPAAATRLHLAALPEHDRLLGYELWSALRASFGLAVLYAPTFLHERLLTELATAFPAAKTAVFSPEQRSGELEKLLRQITQGKIQILIGGPAIARAWGFTAVMVGVIELDYLLQLPDFRTTERTYGLLKKLGGLAKPGADLIIQTGVADHPVLAALTKPYGEFASSELAERQLLRLPPAERLTRILFTDQDQLLALKAAEAAAGSLRAAGHDASVSDAAMPLRHGQYRCQVLVRGNPSAVAGHLDLRWNVEVDPITLL